MLSIQEIEECLLDQDGSCRDINFESPSWNGVTSLIRWFCQNYTILSATTALGTDIRADLDNWQTYELSAPLLEGYIDLSGVDLKAMITGLQVFVEDDENGAPFVELTFFPENLGETFTGMDFVHFVEEMRQMLQASKYYVRCENASWKFGTSGAGTRVIFQSGDVKDIV